MNSALGTVKEFVESYPWVIASFFTGIFIGLLIALPLGWELPEPGGTLFAAAVGAAAAVGGAIWAAKYKQDAEVVEHEGQREDEITDLRQAVARALSADINLAIQNLQRLEKSLVSYDSIAEYLGHEAGFKMAITNMPAFDRLTHLLPQLGEPLSSSLIHVDVEMLRINAELNGLNAATVKFTEGFKDDIQEILRDLETARNLVNPYITRAFSTMVRV